MAVYSISLLFIIISNWCLSGFHLSRQKRKYLYCWIVGIFLTILASVRDVTTGVDVVGYAAAFHYLGELSWKDLFQYGWEPGYLAYNKILSLFFSDEQALLVVTGILTTSGYTLFIYRYSKTPWLSFFLFICLAYFSMSISILRQSLAMVIILNSLKYVLEKKKVKYFLCVGLASLFHTTALICVPIYFLPKLKISIKYFVIALLVSFVIMKIFGRELVAYSVLSFKESYLGMIESGQGYAMLLLLIFATGCGLLISKIESGEDKLFFHLMIFACCLQFFATQFSLLARLVSYFAVAMIIFIPNVITSLRNSEYRMMGNVLCVCLCIAYYYLLILARSAASGIVIYKFMWE